MELGRNTVNTGDAGDPFSPTGAGVVARAQLGAANKRMEKRATCKHSSQSSFAIHLFAPQNHPRFLSCAGLPAGLRAVNACERCEETTRRTCEVRVGERPFAGAETGPEKTSEDAMVRQVLPAKGHAGPCCRGGQKQAGWWSSFTDLNMGGEMKAPTPSMWNHAYKARAATIRRRVRELECISHKPTDVFTYDHLNPSSFAREPTDTGTTPGRSP